MSSVRTACVLTLCLAATSWVACDRYEAPEYRPFHEGFPLVPPHAPQDTLVTDTDAEVFRADNICDKCHIAAAELQVAEGVLVDGVPVAFATETSNWVTRPSAECHDCHPRIIGIDITQPCPPDAPSEWCRYNEVPRDTEPFGLHPEPFEATTCAGSSCHQVFPIPQTWAIGGDEGSEHETNPDLNRIFPLEGGHASPGCSECHGAGPDDAIRGYAANCSQSGCHGRAVSVGSTAPSTGTSHYPGRRAGWTGATPDEDQERDCMACHATFDAVTNKLMVPTSFQVDNYLHQFNVPHRAVSDYQDSPTPVTPSQRVSDCRTCHRQAVPPAPTDPQSDFYDAFPSGFYGQGSGGNYGDRYCDNCHTTAQPAYAGAHGTTVYSNAECVGCHTYGDGEVAGNP